MNHDFLDGLLLVYGRAAYQPDSADKLLQVMTAVEMFALRNDSESIQAALADRIAFSIASRADRRQEAARTLRSAYQIRSGRTHHGRPLEEVETIERFLGDAWAFFLNALRSVGRFKTRMEFLDHLDRLKYQ
jgi:predicted Zn-dependent protease